MYNIFFSKLTVTSNVRGMETEIIIYLSGFKNALNHSMFKWKSGLFVCSHKIENISNLQSIFTINLLINVSTFS